MRLHWARTGHDSADLHLSLMLWVSAGLRDLGLLSLDGLWLHILRYSPYGGFVDFAQRVCLRAGGTSGSCPSLLALRGIGSGVALGGPGDTLRIYCANGLRTPHSLHILRSWFHFSSGVRAGLPPLSPDALCSVAVSLSPWGATRLGGAIAPIPLPTCGVLSCRI